MVVEDRGAEVGLVGVVVGVEEEIER